MLEGDFIELYGSSGSHCDLFNYFLLRNYKKEIEQVSMIS